MGAGQNTGEKKIFEKTTRIKKGGKGQIF